MCRLLSMLIQIVFFSSLFTPTEGCLDFVCSNTSYENSNNTFSSNLNLLFSSLSSSNVSFYNETIGKEPNAVYGFALCRRDISSDECKDCLQNATEEIKKLCPTKKSATLCLPKCHLRYSDRRIFSILDDSEKRVVWGDWNLKHVKNPIEFHRSLMKFLSNLSYEAAFCPSNHMFAYRNAEFNESNKVYALVQCTQYLSGNDCYSCLQDSMRYVGNGSLGRERGWILGKSCNLCYGLLLQSPTTPPKSTAARQISFQTTIFGIITIGVICILGINAIVVIYIVGNHFRRMEERKMSKDADADADADVRITIQSLQVDLKIDLNTIRAATENFASSNKLGEGGFGPVYKGSLSDGQEIAVKRLSVNSLQGEAEFQNEVALVAKLQHRNLVRILGCCTEEGEKLLVYEYMPNKCLNSFIVDPNLKFCLGGCTDKTKRIYLDWAQRYKIIQGIARGLLYLHEGSGIRIIHRDLKASNVLLDKEMTPKISDFGMARIFEVDQTQANTNRIAGTYGYMSPEYAMHGQYSEKSDVFSFGVMLLEIVSGKKNSSFYQSDNAEDLLSYVWRHWKEGRTLETIDSTLNHIPMDVVEKCIHIGLLCVQEDATARPTMSSVIIMLYSDSISIPLASPPAFYYGSRSGSETFSRLYNAQSATDVTITIPR